MRDSIGGWCHVDSTYTVEIMARAGFDWCCLDMQHGLHTVGGLLAGMQALAAAGCAGYVRVGANRHEDIARALDAGARGVIVPQVSSPEQARAAIAACRYPPSGQRSWGPVRAKLAPVRPEPGALDGAADCFVMIEDRAGLDALDAITTVPGLTGIFVGPADLALSLDGDPYGANADATLEVAGRIAAACARVGIVPAVFAGSGVEKWRRAGFSMLAVDSDSTLLLSAARAAATAAREALSEVRA
ncbi:aldolase/citrate lyase family protein [Pseudonocardia yuanmonensis]|uniref:Aldolase/citrate lyase family protein n=1 Tax=Pseudonocardia yuanmonensis TaxID=1095914 RepID=A0ABP8WM58_9PSEU